MIYLKPIKTAKVTKKQKDTERKKESLPVIDLIVDISVFAPVREPGDKMKQVIKKVLSIVCEHIEEIERSLSGVDFLGQNDRVSWRLVPLLGPQI